MAHIDITTTNGYTATIKPFLTYGQFLDIQKVISSNVKLDPKTQEVSEISGEILMAVTEKTINYLLISLKDADGIDLNNNIKELPVEDGAQIMAKINEVSSKASALVNKKKESK
jgi:hypothetical protein